MAARLPGPLDCEPAGGWLAFHYVELRRVHPVSDRRLPRPLPGPEPGSLSDQRQPAGIEPDVKMILGREGLVSLGIVGRKFERHDTESTAPFTFDNATPPASEPQSLRPPLTLPYASKRLLRPSRALRIGLDLRQSPGMGRSTSRIWQGTGQEGTLAALEARRARRLRSR